MFYTVLENQMTDGGQYGLLYYHFDNFTDALAKYYTICASASVSALPYHSVHILQSDGKIKKQEIFDRRNPEYLPESAYTPMTEEEWAE